MPLPSLLSAPPPRPAGSPCPLSPILSLSRSVSLSVSLNLTHSQFAPSPTSTSSLPSLCVETDNVCPEATSTAYETPQPSDSSLVAEQLSKMSLMQQSFYSQVTESLARFDLKLDDVYDKIAALEANEVSLKAMDAERDKKMDLLQTYMTGLKLHQIANFAYKMSTFTTSLPVLTHVAQPPQIVHPNTQEHPVTT